MQDYSIDIQAEKIYAPNTREYFKEVVRSYYGENYRAAIVTLYSVVIYDLVHKLEVLKDAFGDATAISILNRIEKMQNDNPKSPEWESKVVDLVKTETRLLEVAEGMHVENLQSLRHLCAHPIRKENYELFSPNKETVRAHVRNMLESVLTKKPLLYKNIFNAFILDIATSKFRLLSSESVLDRYISSKYLNNLSIDGVKQIVKSLWKFVFTLDNPDADSNREINLEVLVLLISKYRVQLLEMIRQEVEYYSNINPKYYYEIVSIVNEYHEIYEILRDSEKDELQSKISSLADLQAYAWFVSKTIESHAEFLQSDEYFILQMNFADERIDPQTLVYLEKILRSSDGAKANYFVANMYRKSRDYDTADERFSNIVGPNLKFFSKDDFILLLNNIEGNSQLYDRRRAPEHNREIKREIESRFPGQINYSGFYNFNKRS